MLAKHFSVFIQFKTLTSFTAHLQLNTRFAKFCLLCLIVLGMVGVFFAFATRLGVLLIFATLDAQILFAKNTALLNLMTILILPMITYAKVTLPTGQSIDIRQWFAPPSKFVVKPKTIQGKLYLIFAGLMGFFSIVGLGLQYLENALSFTDIFGLIILALAVAMYIYALNRSRLDPLYDQPPPRT